MNKKLVLVLMIVAAIVVSACSGQTESEADSESCEASVTGTVTFPGHTVLPEDAIVDLIIYETSEPYESLELDPPIVGEEIDRDPGPLPIAYEVCYDPDRIQENETYSMYVVVRQMPSWMEYGVNEALNPVITGGNPTENIEIIVTPSFLETQQ